MVAMELLEACRYLNYLRRGESIALVNDKYISPVGQDVNIDINSLKEALRSTAKYVFLVRATDEAMKHGYPIGANMVMYGFVIHIFELLGLSERDIAMELIKRISRSNFITEINSKLFNYGYQLSRRYITNDVLRLLKPKI